MRGGILLSWRGRRRKMIFGRGWVRGEGVVWVFVDLLAGRMDGELGGKGG